MSLYTTCALLMSGIIDPLYGAMHEVCYDRACHELPKRVSLFFGERREHSGPDGVPVRLKRCV
jgi:hypothetical protein